MKKLNRKSVSLPLLREPAPAPYFHPLFFNFQIRPLGEVVKIPSPFKKGEVGLNYAGVQCHDEQIRHVTHLQTFTIKFWVKTTINLCSSNTRSRKSSTYVFILYLYLFSQRQLLHGDCLSAIIFVLDFLNCPSAIFSNLKNVYL